jgi:hypothetical protein
MSLERELKRASAIASARLLCALSPKERTDDDRMVEWIETKREHGFYVLTREELDQRIDEACTDAYAEGRADQIEEHRPALAVLDFAARHLSGDWPERCQEIVRRARAVTIESPAVQVPTPNLAPLFGVVAQILDAGHMNTEDLARLRAAWEDA